MAKIKVHELAKELGKESKDVIAFLSSNGIEAKAQSGVEEDMAAKVRANFGGASEKPAAKEAAPEKKEAPADKDAAKKARPVDKDGNPIKKKKNVFVVTRDRDDRRRRGSDSSRSENRDGGRDKRNNSSQPQQPRGPIRPRSFADGVRPSQRASAQSNDTEFVSKKKPVDAEAPRQAKRPERPERSERPERGWP